MPPSTAEDPRARAARILIACGLALGVALSWKLWFPSDRLLPDVPLIGVLGQVPGWVDGLLCMGAIACCALFAIAPDKRWPPIVALSCGLALAALDQLRWQPWPYQYWLSILALSFLGRAPKKADSALQVLRWIMVATYFWSGFHKCNSGFFNFYNEIFARGLLADTTGFTHHLVASGAYLAGPFEILLALGLATRRVRPVAVILASTMHLMITAFLSPLFGGDNPVILPWNAVMIGLNFVLFWKCDARLFSALPRSSGRWVSIAIGVLVFAMPALSLVRAWPGYFSFHLYSGQNQRMQLILLPRGVAKLPEPYQALLGPSPVSETLKVIDLMTWALDEFNCPMPDRSAVLLHIGRHLAETAELNTTDGFFYHDFPFYLTKRGWQRLSPEQIQSMESIPPLQPPNPQ